MVKVLYFGAKNNNNNQNYLLQKWCFIENSMYIFYARKKFLKKTAFGILFLIYLFCSSLTVLVDCEKLNKN